MLHVLYLITRAEMGGTQVHLIDLLRGFRGQYQLSLVCGEQGFLTDEAERLGVKTYVLPNLVQPLQPHRDIRALGDVRRLIREIRPDLVHCHNSKAGIIGRLAARLAGVPAVFTAHTWSFAEGTSRLWKLVGVPSERFTARFTQRIISVSESNRTLAISRGVAPAERIVTVHNGIPDTPFRVHHGVESVPRIVMVARFAAQKNQTLLVKAVAGIEAPFRLTFVGEGPTRAEVETLAERVGVQDRIEFAGSRKDIDRILGQSSIFVLATNWEGFPITILEAMRAGLPVIATDVDGVREAVEHGVTGLLVPKDDGEALRLSVERLLMDRNLRIRLGRAGRQRYETHFTHAAMLRKTASVYEEIYPHLTQQEPALQSA